MNIQQVLSTEFGIRADYVANLIELLNEGNTIPFIARYRKEMHGGCDDQVIREFSDRLTYLVNLTNRKEEVKTSIEAQEKWTEELAVALDKALTLTEVEDIYRPYRPKKKTRASVAIERGLEPLADYIQAQEGKCDIDNVATQYINADNDLPDVASCIQGASDIVAERISDNADIRKTLRALLNSSSNIVVKLKEDCDKEKAKIYETYKQHCEPVAKIPSHRVLAINRGEKEGCLDVSIDNQLEMAASSISGSVVTNDSYRPLLETIINDSYTRLIFPSIEREVRNQLTDMANEQAIRMFENNLRPLLMQPPLKGKTIMGLDPGYRTGCKVAVIDSNGNVLAHDVIYPTHDNRVAEAERIVATLIAKHKVTVISIGNGTASKETEIFVANLIAKLPVKVNYIITNEAGASIYSASKLAAEEFPEYDLTIRSAISIARRLQDPLAELIKIDVKGIGVGQYQHDMPQKRLTQVLEGVVENCVNSVGVDLNTASYSLLAYVSGLNSGIAKNIVQYRKTKPFASREELLQVSKLGAKAYQQCAGFLRIPDSNNVLDNTAVHPESYAVAQQLLAMFNYSDEDVRQGKLHLAEDIIAKGGYAAVAQQLSVGEPTLIDIVSEISKPGRDIRDSLPQPVLKAELLDIKNLKVGMQLDGVVRNVIDFGAFVDIGVHQDGLVHLSEISDRYIKHASEVLKVGDIVKVRVIGVDLDKNRIALSMKDPDAPKPQPRDKTAQQGKPQQRNKRPNVAKEASYEDKLAQLMKKFNKR